MPRGSAAANLRSTRLRRRSCTPRLYDAPRQRPPRRSALPADVLPVCVRRPVAGLLRRGGGEWAPHAAGGLGAQATRGTTATAQANKKGGQKVASQHGRDEHGRRGAGDAEQHHVPSPVPPRRTCGRRGPPAPGLDTTVQREAAAVACGPGWLRRRASMTASTRTANRTRTVNGAFGVEASRRPPPPHPSRACPAALAPPGPLALV